MIPHLTYGSLACRESTSLMISRVDKLFFNEAGSTVTSFFRLLCNIYTSSNSIAGNATIITLLPSYRNESQMRR